MYSCFKEVKASTAEAALSARFHVNSIIQIVLQLSPYAGLKVRSLK